MVKFQNSSQNIQETDDLLITPYLKQDQLPPLLARLLPTAVTPNETAIPIQKTSVQKTTFLATLPEEFETGLCISRASEAGISRRPILRWVDDWVQDGMTVRLRHGVYKKRALVY